MWIPFSSFLQIFGKRRRKIFGGKLFFNEGGWKNYSGGCAMIVDFFFNRRTLKGIQRRTSDFSPSVTVLLTCPIERLAGQ